MTKDQMSKQMVESGYVPCTEAEAREARVQGHAYAAAFAYHWESPRDSHWKWYVEPHDGAFRAFRELVSGVNGCRSLGDYLDKWPAGKLYMFEWFRKTPVARA
ncbi:hypothetical protein [Myxococcus sp. CA040A]|uniref:hypothetical protein n=1 Tax=Myxococcus sp. CA040A TaxID=2741738 RepID=UPI00157AE322|nr:hypothetical protein [Myxococcus sp. CA040A]NTX08970.1 hypothetical protein [Myxococcus sp. CA040A]